MGNPSRGCGTKKEDGCYGEGPEEAEGGILRGWSWVLGDGINNVIPLNIPPLIMVICNPAATLAARELVKTSIGEKSLGPEGDTDKIRVIKASEYSEFQF